MGFFDALFGSSPSYRIDGTTARAKVTEGAVLLDVRSPGEVAGGALKGAANIPVGELSRRVGELDKTKVLVVYCRSGARSSQAVSFLRGQGFEAWDLGPMSAW